MQLDYAWQASFSPPISGPYTVQCGKEAKTVEVTLQPIARQAAPEDGSGLLILVLCCLFIICLFIAFLAIARHLNSGRTEFVKSIGRNKAKLLLRVGARLSQIEITDPVSMDFKGPPLIFSIGSLANGQEWAYEYETEGQALVLPASLSAISKEGKVSILSSLFSSDGKLFSPAQKGPGRTAERASTSGLPLKKERKKLPKL
ncbi:MAG: hypothetical protein NT051_02300 [Candidatus Micrarchaeota archaeon]|nr:hypothetical protein [Candidatus Micrarchaeota archaeon]